MESSSFIDDTLKRWQNCAAPAHAPASSLFTVTIPKAARMAQSTQSPPNGFNFLLRWILGHITSLIAFRALSNNMHVPDLNGLKSAPELGAAASIDDYEHEDAPKETRRPKGFGRAAVDFAISDYTPRTTPAEKKQDREIGERASGCPSGKAFYRCSNGFTGCCSHDPCNSYVH